MRYCTFLLHRKMNVAFTIRVFRRILLEDLLFPEEDDSACVTNSFSR